MQFNSLQFGLLLVVAVPLLWAARGRLRLGLLLAVSYLFYAAWDWRFLSLILMSTVTDYVVGRALDATEDPGRRRLLMWTSVTLNLSLLGFFKYANFFVDSASEALTTLGLEANPKFLAIALPAGISFYTFQTMSYTIDVYRRRTRHEPDPLAFACFVAYFPQLVAGPIERSETLLPQLKESLGRPDRATFMSGIGLIIEGLVRKVVIADLAAPIVNNAFSHPDPGLALTTTGAFAFAVQVYGDFAGYTAIARGTSRLLGVELSPNFAQPYFSRSLTEFWRRWHMTLSHWLQDYLYIPLGGSRGTRLRVTMNLMVTMLLGGLWHGAGWTYVTWGGINGLYLVMERFGFRSSASYDDPYRWWHVPATIWTTALLCFSFVFFRADSFGHAGQMLGGMLSGLVSLDIGDTDSTAVLLVPIVLLVIVLDVRARLASSPVPLAERQPVAAGALSAVAVSLVLLASGADPVPFVYFRF